jgi:predicted esterase
MKSLALMSLAAAVAFGGVVAPAEELSAGRLIEGLQCAAEPDQTYTLYLPDGYDPAREWPVLLVMDPRGRSRLGAELFREAAAELGWIVVSSDGTRSDSGMEPNRLALNALWPEVHARYSIDPSRIYLAGFSGTVSVAFLVEHETREIAGIIGSCGRYVLEELEGNTAAVFGTAGDGDFNYQEMRALHAVLDERGVPNRLEIFGGGHSWMPPPLARRAVEWMELQAMRRELRVRDDGLVERLFREDLAAARRLEDDGRVLEAMRRYAAIAKDYEGLHEVEEATRRMAALEHDPAIARALKAERRWDDFERRSVLQMNAVINTLISSDTPPPPGRLGRQLGIDDLKRRAERPGVEGAAARRVLAHVLTTTSFYLPRDFLAQDRPGHAAAALEVASAIEPDNFVLLYNRACALALAGRAEAALDALERAVDEGFANGELLASDPDLDSVRETARFRAIAAQMKNEERRTKS